ncbi:MAG: patatin-like protein, partial [Actinomycetota bacterium]
LAIYMHGITKELHKLVIASREYERDSTRNSFEEATTEHTYWEMLKKLEASGGVRWRVVIDIISGTSAGGINGIYLAKALAHDASQDELRNLWMEKGDIKKLVRGPSFLPKWIRMGWALAGSLRHRGQGEPPLRGDLMCRWLLEALDGMEPRVADSPTLVSDANSLDLFVTLTDFHGYPRYIPVRDLTLRDGRHRHVLRFTYDGSSRVDQFSDNYNRMLAFGARGTSCFPGAFAPISLADFDTDVGGTTDADVAREFFRIYELSGVEARSTYFVDGGVLDNFPFGHTIDAIHRKPANSQVVRRLVYIEPDPGSAGTKDLGTKPGWLSTIWGGLSSIPADEPILDDLLRVRARNEKAAQIRDVIRGREDEVESALMSFVGDELPPHPTPDQLSEWNAKSHGRAQQLTGSFYEGYLQIKAASVVRAFAEMLNCVAGFPADSNEAALVRASADLWAHEQKVVGRNEVAVADRDKFLKCFDLPYAARRLRFMIDGINQMYATVGTDTALRVSLDEAKAKLYELRSRFTATLAGRDIPRDLAATTTALLDPATLAGFARSDDGAAKFMEAHGGRFRELKARYEAHLNMSFEGFGTELYGAYQQVTTAWADGAKRKLVGRYLGFPIWDALLFALIEVGDVGELDGVTVVRFSPNEATKLSKEGAKGKLVGVGLHHFKAFFDRPGREKDYTWGRLDGAESIISLLADEAGVGEAADPLYANAFDAVFSEEETLAGARALRNELAERVNALRGRP